MNFFLGVLLASVYGFVLASLLWPNTHITCETFSKNPQPGLFDTFHGKVCSDSFGVENIAKNFKLCLKEGNDDCVAQQYGYFRSSGASKEDAEKALELVLKAANG